MRTYLPSHCVQLLYQRQHRHQRSVTTYPTGQGKVVGGNVTKGRHPNISYFLMLVAWGRQQLQEN